MAPGTVQAFKHLPQNSISNLTHLVEYTFKVRFSAHTNWCGSREKMTLSATWSLETTNTKCPYKDFESRLGLSGCSFAHFKTVLLIIHTSMGMFDNSLIVRFSAQQNPSSYTERRCFLKLNVILVSIVTCWIFILKYGILAYWRTDKQILKNETSNRRMQQSRIMLPFPSCRFGAAVLGNRDPLSLCILGRAVYLLVLTMQKSQRTRWPWEANQLLTPGNSFHRKPAFPFWCCWRRHAPLESSRKGWFLSFLRLHQ